MIKLQDMFQQLEEKAGAGLCRHVPVVKAHPVKKGEECLAPGNFGMEVEMVADTDGWQVERNGQNLFYEDEDFKEEFEAVALDTRHAMPLPFGTEVHRLQEGEEFAVYPKGKKHKPVHALAKQPAFLVSFPDGAPTYIRDIDFHVSFRTNARYADDALTGLFNYKTHLQSDDKPQRYVVVPRETVLEVKGKALQVKPGTVLYENSADSDGYTVVSPMVFAKEYKIIDPANGKAMATHIAHSGAQKSALIRRYLHKR
ncbi:MAG: hypothetical protein EP349_02735 [Alphaproteobacteria bacterium]|nr:MAG: hypothetical protein EP349_02735 [Alphaproteobacteria bacterium]